MRSGESFKWNQFVIHSEKMPKVVIQQQKKLLESRSQDYEGSSADKLFLSVKFFRPETRKIRKPEFHFIVSINPLSFAALQNSIQL